MYRKFRRNKLAPRETGRFIVLARGGHIMSESAVLVGQDLGGDTVEQDPQPETVARRWSYNRIRHAQARVEQGRNTIEGAAAMGRALCEARAFNRSQPSPDEESLQGL